MILTTQKIYLTSGKLYFGSLQSSRCTHQMPREPSQVFESCPKWCSLEESVQCIKACKLSIDIFAFYQT